MPTRDNWTNSKMCTKIPILLILAAANVCHAGIWDLGGEHDGGHGGGWDSGGITLGEISLESHGHKLPTITLGGDSGHGWSGWPKSPISSGGWNLHSDWPSEVSIGSHEYDGHVAPIVKHIGVPVPQEIEIKIPYPVVENTPQRYPVLVPVKKPVPFEVVKTVVKTVEKKVPTPVEKIVPVQVDKPVPFKVYKDVPYPVVKHVPIKIPVHKTIHHYDHHHH